MKKVVKGIHYPQIDVDTCENDCVQMSQNGRDEFNLIIFDKENSKKVALLIHPDLERENEEFAVEFAEWIDANRFTRDVLWTSTSSFYSGCKYTTQELIDIYKEEIESKK